MLENFIGKSQLAVLKQNCNGEEGQFFRDKLKTLENTFNCMPKTYATDGQGDNAVAILHYFLSGWDWWITERDCEDEQFQAFGFACLNGDTQNAETGYISIVEIITFGGELDLYYTPETIGEIKKRINK